MKQTNKLFIVTCLIIIPSFTFLNAQDSVKISAIENDTIYQPVFISPDTSVVQSVESIPVKRSFAKKFWRGCGLSAGLNTSLGLFLLLLPESITKWERSDKFKLSVIKEQYKLTFTQPPVIDKDLWYVNYVGHPYQGAYYFNTMRSQGVDFWTSSLFSLGQSTLWEYVLEGSMEQPSIQDLIITPVLGSIVGELAHRVTLDMRKNGFEWYEKVVVCIINPAYVFNNGFRVQKKTYKY
ncbi:MAG: DUF3943 domain-containing protein [Paludibacter sp.]|nr:DUF3943 domain-containing protein [Paludibacter sp.]